MVDKFNSYYQKNRLFVKTDKILLTVSGGMDSMAMVYLFKQNNLSFGVAHCNFQLRGDDASKDEEFVKTFATNNNIAFHAEAFDTQKYATEKGISIQMAARELRYDWFEKIRTEHHYDYIATAHHKNDVAETMLINLTKGTGLAGLHGIKNKNEKIVRPLLCFKRADIVNYVKENNIPYREDLSNSDTKYTRNAIRHQIIPELEKINPNLIETLTVAANQFLEDEKIIADKIVIAKEQLFEEEDDGYHIEIAKLKELTPLNSYLYYFLRDYNFNASTVNDIIEGLDSQSGKTFLSSTHQIVKDRKSLILKKVEVNPIERIEIKSTKEFPFNWRLTDYSDDFKMETSKQYAYIDAEKIQFPLMLRKWEQGDAFQPLGMKGNKKISDFLIDNKVSVLDKDKIKVLESKDQILWVVGHRIDDNFKIRSSTKKVLILSINE